MDKFPDTRSRRLLIKATENPILSIKNGTSSEESSPCTSFDDDGPTYLPDNELPFEQLNTSNSGGEMIDLNECHQEKEKEYYIASAKGPVCKQLFPDSEKTKSTVGVAAEDKFHKGLLGKSFLDNYSKSMENLKVTIKKLQDDRKQAFKKGKKSLAKRKGKAIKVCKTALMSLSPDIEDLHEPQIDNHTQDSAVNEGLNDLVVEELDEILSAVEDGNNDRKRYRLEMNIFEECAKKKPAPKKARKKNFCIYCDKLITNYSRHIETVHRNTTEGIALLAVQDKDPKKRKLKKEEITNSLRKRANNVWNERNLKNKSVGLSDDESTLISVKSGHISLKSNSINKKLTKCLHCLGLYRRDKLSVHLKYCEKYKNTSSSPFKQNIQAIKEHSYPLVKVDGVSDQLKLEIIRFMRVDDISDEVSNDPLILEMGANFHKSRRHYSERKYVTREIRDMARLSIQLQKLNPNITKLEDAMCPTLFKTLIQAMEILCGYNKKTGEIKVVGMAYRILPPFLMCCKLAKKTAMEEIHRTKSKDRSKYKKIKDFIILIKEQWADVIGRVSTKAMKKNKILKIPKMALEEDIIKLCTFFVNNYPTLIKKFENNTKNCALYNIIMDMIVSHVMCLIRRRPVDLTRAMIDHYNLLDKHDELINMVKDSNLAIEDLDACKYFHIFYVPGKRYDIVPIVLTPAMKQILDVLIKHREDVKISSKLLFVYANNKEIDASRSLEHMKKNVKLRKPAELTGNGLRHQAATFSKLHSNHPLYQDYLASALGHTLFIHKKNYDLPTSILQKLIVCPVLHKMTVDNSSNDNLENSPIPGCSTDNIQRSPSFSNAKNNRRHTIDSISDAGVKNRRKQLKKYPVIYDSSEEEINDNQTNDLPIDNGKNCHEKTEGVDSCESDNELSISNRTPIKRKKWSTAERETIFTKFWKEILEKRCPPRSEIIKFLKLNKHVLGERTDAQVVTFISNASQRKMKNISPAIKKLQKKLRQ